MNLRVIGKCPHCKAPFEYMFSRGQCDEAAYDYAKKLEENVSQERAESFKLRRYIHTLQELCANKTEYADQLRQDLNALRAENEQLRVQLLKHHEVTSSEQWGKPCLICKRDGNPEIMDTRPYCNECRYLELKDDRPRCLAFGWTCLEMVGPVHNPRVITPNRCHGPYPYRCETCNNHGFLRIPGGYIPCSNPNCPHKRSPNAQAVMAGAKEP